jgi:hypothetical protein
MIKSRRMRWAGNVAHMGTMSNAYTVLIGKSEGERPLGRPRRRREVNIKMDRRETVCLGVHLINLAQDRDYDRLL